MYRMSNELPSAAPRPGLGDLFPVPSAILSALHVTPLSSKAEISSLCTLSV